MKTYIHIIKTVMMIIVIVSVITSCAKKVQFQNSQIEPAAEGSVKVDKDGNDNYSIDLSVLHLPEPERLTPPKTTYMVWMETAQNGTQKIGQLKTSSGTFSRTMKSSLSSTTPFEPTSFFITAEDNGEASEPGNMIVLKTFPIQW
jgi:hypothetical protein